MSNPIVNNGNVVGTSTGNEVEYVIERENGNHYPTTYNTADKVPIAGGSRVTTLQYPIKGNNNHFVRFYINIGEESRLVKLNQVATVGPVDLSEQDRAFKNQTSQDAINAGATLGGAVIGAQVGGAAVRGAATLAAKNLFKRKLSGGALAGAGAVGIVGGAAAGVAAGDAVGELISDYLQVTNKLLRLAVNITLYTPPTVRVNYDLNYDMPEDLLVALSQSENYEALQAALATIGSPMTGDTLGRFGRIIATSASPTVSVLSRTTFNMKKDVMFKYVGNRQFVFDYTFAPQSPEEASIVSDIIFMFKYFAHPEMLPGYGNFLYLYPAEFDIEYGMVQGNATTLPPNERPNLYLNKISSCVLTAIDVDYAPGNSSFQSLEKGEPMVTTLRLAFREIETLHRDRIGMGY